MEKIAFNLILCFVLLFKPVMSQVPAVFIFGDSTVDVGTNNFLNNSGFRADFPHNGIDFPQSKPTGRFSNGFNGADILAQLIGFDKSPPPYFTLENNTQAFSTKTFRGANFASAGSGILSATGDAKTMPNKFEKMNSPQNSSPYEKPVISLHNQILQFNDVRQKLIDANGPQFAKGFLAKALYFFSVGSNDLFLYHQSLRSVPKARFISALLGLYERHLLEMISLGARKFGIFGVPPIGCCPASRNNVTGDCSQELNDLSLDFYNALRLLLIRLSTQRKDIKYSLGHAYAMTMIVIQDPGRFQLKEVQSACCGTGTLNAEGICDPKANLCSKKDRDQFLFWDLYHPTQAASKLAAYTLFTGGPQFLFPINFKQLVES